MPDQIPAPILQFLADNIRSIAQLELLLMLHQERDSTWTVPDAAKRLYTAVSMTEPLLETLRAIGLVVFRDGHYQYAPKSTEMDALIGELAQLYQERRVTIINLIYSAPMQKLQNFADAFRIRKQED
jgi:two-component SAPR family response regulator